MTQYRIVTDEYAGYEIQKRSWYWPFWHQVGVNTSSTPERAKARIEQMKNKVVWTEGDD